MKCGITASFRSLGIISQGEPTQLVLGSPIPEKAYDGPQQDTFLFGKAGCCTVQLMAMKHYRDGVIGSAQICTSA